MLSVNQLFYGTDEPVWLVDGPAPNPVKYHYLGSAHRATVTPPPRVAPPPRRTRDPYYPHDEYEDPYYTSSRRRDAAYYSPPRSRSVRPPIHFNAPPPPPAPVATMPYSSVNPPPAPAVVPSETPISGTPVVPVVPPTIHANIPYTMLLKVPICCEGCEKRVVKRLLKVPGVNSVTCDIDRQRVTVRGTADTDEVLTEAKRAFKKSRLW